MFPAQFEDLDSLKGYMSEHHESIMGEFLPEVEALAVGGKVHQQNFVCAPPQRSRDLRATPAELPRATARV